MGSGFQLHTFAQVQVYLYQDTVTTSISLPPFCSS
jgi:hypothetical protein